jgi:hypothetical protein
VELAPAAVGIILGVTQLSGHFGSCSIEFIGLFWIPAKISRPAG